LITSIKITPGHSADLPSTLAATFRRTVTRKNGPLSEKILPTTKHSFSNLFEKKTKQNHCQSAQYSDGTAERASPGNCRNCRKSERAMPIIQESSERIVRAIKSDKNNQKVVRKNNR
jgi:hypothetical protein